MTTTNDKLRSVLLSAMLVMSVFAGVAAFAGSATAANSADAAGADAGADSGSTFWAGQTLWVDAGNANSDTTWQIREVDDNSVGGLTTEFTLNETGEAVVSTSDLSGEYVIVDSEGTPQALNSGSASDATDDTDPAGVVDDAKWEVATQSFSTSVNRTNVTTAQDFGLNLDSNRGSYEVEVTSSSLDSEDLQEVFGEANYERATDDGVVVQGESSGTISGLTIPNAGEYTLDLSVVDTDASGSVDLSVTEQGGATYSLAESYPSEQRGDVGEITVELENTDSATVQFGGDDVNFAVWADVTDADGDGEVTLEVHTAASNDGNAANILTLPSNSDDEISNQTFTAGSGLQDPIQAGDYGITVYDETGSEQTFGTFVLNERSTDDAQTWAASSADLSDSDAVYDAISESDTIALQDAAVVQVQASGLYDYFESADDFGTNGLSMDVAHTNPGANQNPSDIAAENYDVVTDAENNTFFVVVDTSNAEAGQEFNATFTVSNTADGDIGTNEFLAEGESESVSTTFSVVDREVTFDTNRDGVYAVPNGEVNVTGSSTLAAGTEIQITARSTAANLLQSQTVTVEDDGSWSAPFDFSDVDNGTEFTFTNGQTDETADAIVDENVETGGEETTEEPDETEETTTTEETETTTTEETTTETTTTEEPEDTTTTEDGGDGGIPGFGISVSLVALLAAALLALRRSN